jgi:Xaa-Pro aminopeptidase
MRADLDRLMEEVNLDAFVVWGDETPNTYRDYLTGRAKASGTILKKRGETAVFIVSGMEVDEAAHSGLTVRTPYDFGLGDLAKQYKGDTRTIQRELFLNYFRLLGITGRVAFYGAADVANVLNRFLAMQPHFAAMGIEAVVEGDAMDLFNHAYETKDTQEIDALKHVGKLTSEVVRRVWNMLSACYATGEETGAEIVDEAGKPVTVGDVKRFVRAQMMELGLEDLGGFIFAQGRDAGMPHSEGTESDVLRTGQSIVFDYFPRDIHSGYFHDMTRTWSLGHATEEVQNAYNQVLEIFNTVSDSIKVGDRSGNYQVMTLDYFESKGHKTQRSHPGTLEGYVHSLGHGLGLNIHEVPSFGEHSPFTLRPGNAVTIEPGLYYPERGFGIRVEDTVYFDENGTLHTITDFPYDLVLPLKGVKKR